MPDGSLIGTCGSEYEGISRVRDEVFFLARPGCGNPHLYMRADGQTTDVSASQCTLADCGPEAPAGYLGVSPDGSTVFFSSTERLTDADNEGKPMIYRYDVDSGTLQQVFQQPAGSTASSLGDIYRQVRSSADGSRVLFLAEGLLLPGQGSETGTNLYLADGSGLRFVAPEVSEPVFASADGRYAVFATLASLDPRDTDSSGDVYRYDADSGQSTLISGGTAGGDNGAFEARLPTASAALPPPPSPAFDEGQRVVFTTAEPLLPQDRNDKEDVYEWTEAGGLALVSGGVPGLPGTYLAATPDAGTVLSPYLGDAAAGRSGLRPTRHLRGPDWRWLPGTARTDRTECAGSECDESLGVSSPRLPVLVVLRPPPDVSLYHRHSNPLFPQTLKHLGSLEDVHAFVIPRTDEQRDYVKSLALPSVIVPDEAVDAQSLIALADLVVSAGGTMNREAAALGVPVYTTYGGRLGGVDEQLIRDGRLRPLTDPRALDLHKRERSDAMRIRRDPQLMLDLLLSRSTRRGRRARARRRRSARAWPGRRPAICDSSPQRPRRACGDRVAAPCRGRRRTAAPRPPRARSSRHRAALGRAVRAGVGTNLRFGGSAPAALRRDAELGEEARGLPDQVSQSTRFARVIPT